MTPISKIQHARFYIYRKQKSRNGYLYTKSQTLCKKQDNLRYVLFTKSLTLYVTQFFMKSLKLVFIDAQKLGDFALRDVFIKKIQTIRKIKTICVTFLIYKNLDTLR